VEVPETRYARSGEMAIAYQVCGAGDHDLLLSLGSGSNAHVVWSLPEAVRLFERLGRFARVINYDRRDTGLSDPIKDDLTLEAHADDALAVMDAAGAQRPVLMGSADGARSLALLAATRPQRVGGLVAFSPSVRGAAASNPEVADIAARTIAELADYPGPMLAHYAPRWAADPVRAKSFKRYLQACLTPRQAARALRMSLTSDISEALPLVQAPTLVVRPRDLAMVPADVVRVFTDLIPEARLREIPGDANPIFANDVELVADIVEEFITGAAPSTPTSRVLATVLFTDLVDSTRHAADVGDRTWSSLIDRHLTATRAVVDKYGGQTVKSTGDGVLALFTGPAQSVRCAGQIISDARDLGLEVRTGLHTGEVERGSDDVAGLAVHLAARIMGLAQGGEILASRTVRDLVIGSELTFTDRGEHELKGIPDRWTVYAATA
jgi:class 3 adenylate cyclase